MAIQTLYSAKRIELQFHTGEEPVMVMCSDVNIYVCKYMRSSATAYKLACELIGARLAKAWRLTTPDYEYLSRIATTEILYEMPKEWKVPVETLKEKLNQLSDGHWTAAVWQNFMDCLNENIA